MDGDTVSELISHVHRTGGLGLASRGSKRSTDDADLDVQDIDTQSGYEGDDHTLESLTGYAEDTEDYPDEYIEEDLENDPPVFTRFDVEADDATDMPRVGEEVLEPFSTRPNYSPSRYRHNSTAMMVVVDVSGVHEIPVVFCGCADAAPRDIQLLRTGLYPATSRRPRTAFTFRVLDDFLLTNKECKTPGMSYYSRLRRITNDAFPHMVPVSLVVVSPIRTSNVIYPNRRIRPNLPNRPIRPMQPMLTRLYCRLI